MNAQKKKQQRITYLVICGVLLASSFFLFVVWMDGQAVKEGSIVSRTSLSQHEVSAIIQKEKKSENNENTSAEHSDEEANVDGGQQTSSTTKTDISNSKADASTPNNSITPSVEEPEQKQYVTISIDMKNILNHMDLVDESTQRFVISSGIVLSSTQVSFTKGETVYSILQRICQEKGIPLVTSQGYINAIHNIGEMDAGKTSGWLYTVNGEVPSVGSTGYRVKENDVIAWRYTVIQGDV